MDSGSDSDAEEETSNGGGGIVSLCTTEFRRSRNSNAVSAASADSGSVLSFEHTGESPKKLDISPIASAPREEPDWTEVDDSRLEKAGDVTLVSLLERSTADAFEAGADQQPSLQEQEQQQLPEESARVLAQVSEDLHSVERPTKSAEEEEVRRRREVEWQERRRHSENELRRLKALRKAREAEEQQKMKEEEDQETRARQEAFLATMPPEQESRMRAMLHVVSLYHQQLQQNEGSITTLHNDIASQEKTYRSLHRRTQQATQDVTLAQQQEAQARAELARWSHKRESFQNASDEGTGAARAQCTLLQSECGRLREEAMLGKAELNNLRDRLASSEETGREQALRLAALKAECLQLAATVKAEILEGAAALRAQHAEELGRLEVGRSSEVGELRPLHAEEASKLRGALQEALQQQDLLRKYRDEAVDMLLAREREGSRLQKHWADARQELVDVSLHVNAYQAAIMGAWGTDALFRAHGDDRRMDAHIEAMQQYCRMLERECARTRDALEKRQVECERWRARCLEKSDPLDAAMFAPRPFMLGPEEGELISTAALPWA